MARVSVTKHPTHLELHGRDLVHETAHLLLDNSQSDLLLAVAARFAHMTSLVVERNHIAQHGHGLPEGAVAIVVRETVCT